MKITTLYNCFYFYFFNSSYFVHIDANGDAAGNYTIVSRMFKNDPKTNKSIHGLFPVGVFVPGLDNNRIPVSSPSNSITHLSIYCDNFIFSRLRAQ